MATKGSTLNLAYWLHLLLVILAWTGPFLFSWQLMVAGYTIIMLQFLILKKCVVNNMHDLDDSGYYIFYTFLLEQVGIYLSEKGQKRLYIFIRRLLYPLLSIVAILWQVYLGFEPLIF